MSPASLSLTRDTPTTLRSLLFSERAQRGWLALLAVLCLVVVVLACRPGDSFHPTLGWDKLNHVSAFLVLAFCGHFGLREKPRGTFWLVFLLVALGVAIELVQMYVPGRSADVEDLMADFIGLAVGLVIALQLGRRLDRRKRPRRRSVKRAT